MRRFSDEQIALVAARSRALGDATRVRILSVLERGEQSVGQIADNLKSQQSTVSKHLQVLFHAGLVQRRREASAVIYGISTTEIIEWCRYLGARQFDVRRHDVHASRMNSSRADSEKRSSQRARG
jgi:DNA-binding transcriptional ArsR family regulator